MSSSALKSDKFREARGGWSRLLQISCEKCGQTIAVYQKDGPGMLKRMYLDRISDPDELVGLQNVSFKKLPNLVCSNCKTILGIPFLYKKESRPSFRLFVGAVTKKIVKT